MKTKTTLAFLDIQNAPEDLQEKVRLWRNQDEIRKFMVTDHVISREEHRCWLSKLPRMNQRCWVVMIDEEPAGAVSLKEIDREHQTADWGMYIGEERFRGRGLAGNILKEFFNYCFYELGFQKLTTNVLATNQAAFHVYGKFPFCKKKNAKIGPENRSLVFLEMSRGLVIIGEEET